MKKWQFDRYIKSYKCRDQLLGSIDFEISELYENVAPVLTKFNYDKLTAGSVSVEEYAFYIIERKAILSLRRNRIEKECQAVTQLLETLDITEKKIFFNGNLNYSNFKPFAERLRAFLKEDEYLVEIDEETKGHLLNEDLESLSPEEYDAAIDQMYEEAVLTGEDSGLLDGYFDKDDTFDCSIVEREEYIAKTKVGRKVNRAV